MAEKRYVGAIDQGTTSTRFILFDRGGKPVASRQLEHAQMYPRPGWVEHDPELLWDKTREVIRGAISSRGIDPSEIAAIGVTNQRETIVVWDRATGKSLCNAIVWQDTRSASICEELAKDGGQGRFQAKTGLPLATYFSGPKLKWLLDAEPDIRKAAEKGDAIFGTIDSWLIYKLSGGKHVTDPTNASRTMLMDLKSLAWDDSMCALFGVPLSMLPEIRSSSDPNFYGMTRADGPFGAEIPICGDLGDQQAALFGQACYVSGEAKNTYGTGCFLLMNTGEKIVESKQGLISTVAYRFGNDAPVYALEGSVAIAGASVQWARDSLGFVSSAPELDTLAALVPDSGGVYFVPAFSGLFAPYWRSDARGAFLGLTHFATKAHMARAILDATAYQSRDLFEAMRKDSGISLTELKADGGMTASDLLMQFQADLLGVPVVRPAVRETTALGAAYAAGLAVGFWKGLGELKNNWARDKTWKPSMDESRRALLVKGWDKAVTKSFGWASE